MTETSIVNLEKRADEYAAASLAPSTRRAYEADWAHFAAWCASHDMDSLPASPETVCLYLTALADANAKKTTINRRKVSIGKIHDAAGQPNPIPSHQVRQVSRGIKRSDKGSVRRARPLLWRDVTKMTDACDWLIHGIRDRTIILLGWAGALRRGELSGLNVGDIEFVDEGMLVTIRRSKTDQEGTGKTIGVPNFRDPYHCPVVATKNWIGRLCHESGVPDPKSPLFRRLGMAAMITWWLPTEQRLSGHAINLMIKKRAVNAGIMSASVSAHSLRRGLATEAASKGVPERVISRHTRHASLAVLREYIEAGTVWSDNPLAAFASQSPSSGASSSSDEDLKITR